MEPIGYVTIPVYALSEGHFTGLRQGMIEAGPHGASSGAGLGSDSIWTEIDEQGKTVYRQVCARDVLAAVLELVKHPDRGRVPTTAGYKAQVTDGAT